MQTNAKILIIDDEEVVLDSCTRILAGSHYDVATAATAKSGLQLVREGAPDLVFVDLKMPGMSGFEVLEAIRALDPSVVTIVITGYATVSSAVEAMKRGAYDFLPKPFTPDEFRLITRRGLEHRRLIVETNALRREKEILRRNFAAIVSHELKAPLGAVQQGLYALAAELAGQITEDQKRRLERLKLRIEDLLKLIHTWLRVISADMGAIQESFEPVPVQDVLAKALESVQPLAARKDITLECCAQPRARVMGDVGTLVEALVNILGNAIKYSHAGSRVWVTVEERKGSVLIAVADQGVGIAPEDLPFIFEGFYSGKTAPETERGCGLGLAISRRIVEAHQGAISVESQPGKGSTFVIRLPVLQTDGEEQPEGQPEIVAQKGARG